MVTYAGNPVLSVPNGRRLARALGALDFFVAVDIYVNETTRHAHVILPPCWGLAEDHVNLLFSQVSVRNVARWSPPVVAKAKGERADWEILLELAERLGGGPTGTPWLDRLLALARPLGLRFEPTAVADLLLRLGPHGDRFLPWSSGLSMRRLKAAPHGKDLGPLRPGFRHRISHADGRIHLAPPPILEALARLETELDKLENAGSFENIENPRTRGTVERHDPPAAGTSGANGGTGPGLVLIGRRELRSNNSWMHNVASLVSGRQRCVLLVHPDDARARDIADGDFALLGSRVHRGPVLVRTSPDMRAGVVSLPHGWGHGDSAPWQRVAGDRPGVSINDWTDDQVLEPILGQSILNGVPVTLEKLPPA
jgi:anaerobic selenocysteine-containing dehydrogenase